jgi:glycosyltransferase involved in cell wall biosynthesis
MSDEKRTILIQAYTLNQSTRASKIARTLISGGYYVTFLGWDRGSKSIEKEQWKKKDYIKEIQMRLKAPIGIKIILFYPIWWCFVFFALMTKKWDIAYAINLESIPPAVIAGKLKGRPVIYDNLDSWEEYLPLPNVIRKIIIKIDKIFMQLVNSIILADEMQVEEMGGIPNSKVVAVYDSPEDITDVAFKNDRSNKKFTLFYAGGLFSARALNLDKAFNAIKDLEGVKLVIAGYGDLVDEIKDWSREVPEKIQFIGGISHEEVLLRIVEADLLFVFRSPRVLANKYICGSKLLETMMCGRPILVNKGTSTANKVLEENCGLVVDANNIEEIKEAMIKLRDNPELCKELGANARKAYEERYSWEIMGQRLVDIYRELTGEVEEVDKIGYNNEPNKS